MGHKLRKFCEERDLAGAVNKFGGDHNKLAQFIFKSKIPLMAADSSGLGRLSEQRKRNAKHLPIIKSYAFEILKEEIEEKDPNIFAISKTIDWITRTQEKKEKFDENILTTAKRLLERGKIILNDATEKEKVMLEISLGFAATMLVTSDNKKHLKFLKELEPYCETLKNFKTLIDPDGINEWQESL